MQKTLSSDGGHELPVIKTQTPENNHNEESISSQVYYPLGFSRKVMAEVVATFMLVFVTCGSAALTKSDEHKVSQLGASVAGGLIVTVMIYAVGHISGAHMNPAVALAFASIGHFPWIQVPYLRHSTIHRIYIGFICPTDIVTANRTIGHNHTFRDMHTSSDHGNHCNFRNDVCHFRCSYRF